jgi:Rod binding domain-containing protein
MIMTLSPMMPAGAMGRQAALPAQNDAKLHQAAQQFEAMFMSEMLRLARPGSKAAGAFAEGQGEKSWQIFMDQALGQAAAAQGGTGLEPEIEQALRTAQGKAPRETA